MGSATLNAAILGTGFMGQQHARRLSDMPDVAITAICDSNAGAAASLKETLGCGAALFTDFGRMLAETKLDLLYVCLPPCAHCGQVEQAAAKGIHLFLEKPIAPDAARAAAMVDAIERAGVVSQVGFHLRQRKGVRRFKALMESGEAGTPTLFDGRYWCNMSGGAWWRDINGSGGQVYEQVIHLYDLAAHFLGRPLSVCAFMDNLCHRDCADYTIEDCSAAVIRFELGALASITGSNCAIPDRFIGDFRVVCRNAVLDYRSNGDWRCKDESAIVRHGDGQARQDDLVEDTDPYGDEDAEFISAIRGATVTRTPARHGLDAIRLVSAVIESAKNDGTPMRL